MSTLELKTEKWTDDHWAAYRSGLDSKFGFDRQLPDNFDDPASYECGFTPLFIALLLSDYEQLHALMLALKKKEIFNRKASIQPYTVPKTDDPTENDSGEDSIVRVFDPKSNPSFNLPDAIKVSQRCIARLFDTKYEDGTSWRFFAGMFNELERFGQISTDKDIWRCKVDDVTTPLQGAIMGNNLCSVTARKLSNENKEWRSKWNGESIYHIAAIRRELPLFVEKFKDDTNLEDLLERDNEGRTPFDLAFLNGTLRKVYHPFLNSNSEKVRTAFAELEDIKHCLESDLDYQKEVTATRSALDEYNSKIFSKIRKGAMRIGQKKP